MTHPDAAQVPADLLDVDGPVKGHPAVALEVLVRLGLGQSHTHEAWPSLTQL